MPLKISQDQVAFNERGKGSFKLPFKEQIDYFNQKNPLPTEHWDDVNKDGHDKSFVVSGAAKADLINDLHSAVKKGIENGKSIQWFRANFDKIVEKYGWAASGPYAWRTRMIYMTNVRTSYSAGRWKQLNSPDLLLLRPYWKYIHNDNVSQPRPEHLAWNGLVLKHDDPWWLSHSPARGFGCRCRIQAVSAREFKGATAPDDGTYEHTDRYGVTHTLPNGIDYGWDFNPNNAGALQLKDIIEQKLIRFPASIGADMWQALKPLLKAEQDLAVKAFVAESIASKQPTGASVVAHVVEPETVTALNELGVVLDDAAIWLIDHDLAHAIRDGKVSRGAALPDNVWLNLSEHLAIAVPYFDTTNNNLLYAFDLPGIAGKVVVRINYKDKVRVGGKRKNIVSNFIATGGEFPAEELKKERYKPLAKKT